MTFWVKDFLFLCLFGDEEKKREGGEWEKEERKEEIERDDGGIFAGLLWWEWDRTKSCETASWAPKLVSHTLKVEKSLSERRQYDERENSQSV